MHSPTTPAVPDVFAKATGHERAAIMAAAQAADVVPYFRTVTSPALPVVEMEGEERIMLGSNNYLGLTSDPRVMQGARDALEEYGTGLTGSRLLNGTIPLHLELEERIASWMGTEAAIVFTTGNQANVGTLSTLLAPGDTVVVDSGDHASILDGCLLSKAKLRPFRHNRLDKLEKQLQRAQTDGGGVLVVVDGVFSMEGDIAPVPEIAELAHRYGARLMVDEAHGAGVLGARGAGTCELYGVEDRVDLRMGTFSKSLASCGGFIAGSAEIVDFLRITSRSFLFTASAVPAAVGAALAAVKIIDSPDGPPLLQAALENARYLRDGLEELGFAVVAPQSLGGRVPGVEDIVTPIVPVLVGDDWKAALLWRALYDAGVFVNTALHPAVPPGGALLRTSVMATHDRATLDRALAAFATVKASFEAEHGPLPGPGRPRLKCECQDEIRALSACYRSSQVDPGAPLPVALWSVAVRRRSNGVGAKSAAGEATTGLAQPPGERTGANGAAPSTRRHQLPGARPREGMERTHDRIAAGREPSAPPRACPRQRSQAGPGRAQAQRALRGARRSRCRPRRPVGRGDHERRRSAAQPAAMGPHTGPQGARHGPDVRGQADRHDDRAAASRPGRGPRLPGAAHRPGARLRLSAAAGPAARPTARGAALVSAGP